MNYSERQAKEFAEFIKSLGFTVYLAKSGTYGFITDNKQERVLSFSFTDGASLSGNYGPPSRESGTGWRLSVTPSQLQMKEDVTKALYSAPDYNVGKGWKRFTTLKEYLAMYGSSSGFEEVAA
jgi:hypothetical protein